MEVWRVHIRPTGGTAGVDYDGSYDLCLRKSIVGIGWRVTESYTFPPKPLGDYLAAGRVEYGAADISWNTAINRLCAMNQHDLVWTRSPKPYRYHLCRIVGAWDYRDSSEYRAFDIVNVRPVEIVEVAAATIPTDLVTRFQGGSTIEPIKNQQQVDFTIETWRKSHGDT